MSLIRWEPFQNLERMFDRDFPMMPFLTAHRLGWELAVDLYEEKGNLIAEMNIPGVDPEKVEVTFQDGNLKILGKRDEEKETLEKNFYLKEMKRGEFERVITLPVKVKTDKIDAHYEKGVLRIVMPLIEHKVPEKVRVKIH